MLWDSRPIAETSSCLPRSFAIFAQRAPAQRAAPAHQGARGKAGQREADAGRIAAPAGPETSREGPRTTKRDRPPPLPSSSSPLMARLIVPFFALSGFTAILYEIAWTRILSVPLGGMVYALSAILALYLLGLAVGSAIGARLLRAYDAPIFWFGIFQSLLAATVALGGHVFGLIPDWQASLIIASVGNADSGLARLMTGEAGRTADIHLHVPHESTARVQEVHRTLLHAIWMVRPFGWFIALAGILMAWRPQRRDQPAAREPA